MSYLLFVRSPADLERACCDVSEFFTFQNRRAPPLIHELLGVWIEPNSLLQVPLELVSRTEPTLDQGIPIRQTFGIAGIWELACLHPPADLVRARNLRAVLIESLCRLGEHPMSGLFVPVFTGPPVSAVTCNELARLRHRYPDVLADPLLQAREGGALMCGDARAIVGAPMGTYD